MSAAEGREPAGKFPNYIDNQLCDLLIDGSGDNSGPYDADQGSAAAALEDKDPEPPQDKVALRSSASTIDNHSRVLRQIQDYEDYINNRTNRVENWLKGIKSPVVRVSRMGNKINDTLLQFEELTTDPSNSSQARMGRVAWRFQHHLWKKYVIEPKRSDIAPRSPRAERAKSTVLLDSEARSPRTERAKSTVVSDSEARKKPVVPPKSVVLSRPEEQLCAVPRRHRREPNGQVIYEEHPNVQDLLTQYQEKRKLSESKRSNKLQYRW